MINWYLCWSSNHILDEIFVDPLKKQTDSFSYIEGFAEAMTKYTYNCTDLCGLNMKHPFFIFAFPLIAWAKQFIDPALT